MTSPEPIVFHQPDITEAEIEAVVAVLRSRWLTTGPKTKAFEQLFAAAVDAPHAVALNSCTAALHLALEALGVGDDDHVFLPSYTFAATAEVVRYLGGVPVLCDVDPVTCNLDSRHLRNRIEEALAAGKKCAAVVPVHFAGVAAEMEEIWTVAREFGLAVVEDAAHAFPATFRGRPVGWMPDDIRGAACFSFYATKTITTGEGGMAVTSSAEVADRMRLMSLHGLSRQAWNRYSGGTWRYDIAAPGYKYNMTDVAAALGVVQLSRAAEMAARRCEIATIYSDAFADLPIHLPTVPADRTSPWHLYVLRLLGDDVEGRRDRLIELLKSMGIGVSMHFIPLHIHSYYRETYGYKAGDLPVSYDLYRRQLSLPIWNAMTNDQVDRVIDAVRKSIGEVS